ncbi:origin recognition complex subunit 2-domain-containing protein [Chaetomium strumarium]|uniref:Origin recognition complex subunit 2 n=1 Tax=Chaetomium strumarium TaxID=1170767 RepID=A0AAJ0GYY7_9PEZI|nr:origin recognition complex subunit 2-domain-containing protein [Chaetomium strumarium]
MARRKAAAEAPVPRASRKREFPVDPYEVPDENETPKRRRRLEATSTVDEGTNGEDVADNDDDDAIPEPSPAKRRGRPPNPAAAGTLNGQATTPSTKRQRPVNETPVKLNGMDTPSRRNIADRSARKKSARALIDRVIGGTVSDDEVEEGDIAREIYESSEDEEEKADERGGVEGDQEPTTPSKSPGRKRGVAARKRSPTPPRDLPPHEQYFYQNKPGLAKTSNNNLSSLNLLTHDEYFSVLRQLENPHASDVDFLQSLHAESFPQWAFELSHGFTTCLYGYGSKRRLLHSFATYLYSQNPAHKIVIINGYVRTLTTRDILSTLSAALPSLSSPGTGGGGSSSNSVGINHSNTLQALVSSLSTSTPPTTLTVLINSLDAPPLRKPATQTLLSQLASHPQIRLAATADTPDFALLWDAGLRAAFNFLFHDCTTFAPFAPCELEVVDEVHELLGRKTRRVGGKEGVAFVLRSLPENARALFRLLVGEVLAAMEEGQHAGEEVAVEYRMVYNKAVEEFICSSEIAFRTLLKE